MDDLLEAADNITKATADAAGGELYVVRVSRTANGARTWTVGASIPADTDRDTVLANVIAMDDRMADLSSGQGLPTKGRVRPKSTLSGELASSLIVETLRKAPTSELLDRHGMHKSLDAPKADSDVYLPGWVTAPELVEATKIPRTTLQYHVAKLVKIGLVEREQGRSPAYPTRYRLAVEGPQGNVVELKGRAKR